MLIFSYHRVTILGRATVQEQFYSDIYVLVNKFGSWGIANVMIYSVCGVNYN